MTPFRSVYEVVAFWGVLGLSLGIAATWIVRHRKPRGKRRHDLFPLIFLVIAGDIALGYARILPLPHWLFYPGEALFVLGACFTTWSYMHLGRYRLPYVEVLPAHQVIEDGPYHYIRHPGYVGAMVALIGLSLAVQSWAALLATLSIGGSLFAQRIYLEEALMKSELGASYVDYMARTKRFVPFVWQPDDALIQPHSGSESDNQQAFYQSISRLIHSTHLMRHFAWTRLLTLDLEVTGKVQARRQRKMRDANRNL